MRFLGPIQRLAAETGPWYLHQDNIGAFLESVGLTLDSSLEALAQGVRLSDPLRCDRSALPVIAQDRSITLYPSESEASQRYRLSIWKRLHRTRATHLGEMLHLQPYFLPDVPRIRIVHQAGNGMISTWHTLNSDGTYDIYRASPTNWNYDSHSEKWSRFWVIIDIPSRYLLTAQTWDDGSTWDDGHTYDRIVDTQTALDIINLIKEWKAGYSRLAGVILSTDSTKFDPTSYPVVYADGTSTLPRGAWGQPVGADGRHTRLKSAIWIYEDAE